MTTFKHNITGLFGSGNLVDIPFAVNTASNSFLAYLIIIILLIVTSYAIIKKTQDIAKGLLQGAYITTVSTLLLYYAGKVRGTDFIPDVIMLGMIVSVALGTAAIKYFRAEN